MKAEDSVINELRLKVSQYLMALIIENYIHYVFAFEFNHVGFILRNFYADIYVKLFNPIRYQPFIIKFILPPDE